MHKLQSLVEGALGSFGRSMIRGGTTKGEVPVAREQRELAAIVAADAVSLWCGKLRPLALRRSLNRNRLLRSTS